MLNHAVTFGGDGVWDLVNTKDDAGGFISATTPSGQRALTGAFVQDEVRYSSWLRVLGALRFDHYNLNGGDTSSSGSHLSPKITIGITPDPRHGILCNLCQRLSGAIRHGRR